jgi:hypothetical protein
LSDEALDREGDRALRASVHCSCHIAN